MATINILPNEPQKLSDFLIGETCSEDIAKRYSEALVAKDAVLTDSEMIIWKRMMSSKFYLRLIDSGLAVVNPQSSLRRRIFIMLCLLETTPEYTSYFLPQPRSIFYIISLGFRLVWSAFSLFLGTILVKLSKVT
jgi:hypothetical protein